MQVERFKQKLLQKEQELVQEISRRRQEALQATEREVRDFGDRATSDQIAGQSLQEETLASDTLTEVRDALQRVADGSYGKCVVCGRQIEAARLEAIPWTPYCLADQEKRDRQSLVGQGGATL